MLLKSLKSNQAYHFLLMPLVAIALWFKAFISPELFAFYPGENGMLLYQPIQYLLGESPLASSVLSLIFMIVLAFLIFKLSVQYSFIRVRTFLPATMFVLITSGLNDLHTMHPIYPATLFLILAVDRIFDAYDKDVIHSNSFESGIFLAIGSLFYFNLVFFFPLLWIGFIIVKQKVNWREFILTTMGFVFPWIAAFAYYLGTGAQDELTKVVISNFSPHPSFLTGNLPILIYIGFLILMTLLSSIFLLTQYDEKKISSRKYFKTFFWIFLITLILTISNRAVSQEIVLIFAIPLTYLISNYLVFTKRLVWGEVFLYLFFAGVIYLQFV